MDKHAISNRGESTLISNMNKKPPSGVCDEALDGNGPPNKKKRQPWTKEEDDELKEAVRKYGEGNWANILKADFKHNRSAAQLSQRWALLRKKDGNSNIINGNKTGSSTRVEERMAANKALSMAVDMPMTGSMALYSGTTTHTGHSSTSSAATSQASRACAAQSLNQSQDKTIPNIFTKSRPPIKKPSFPTKKPSIGPNGPNLIQAAAFAAGGRIANPSTAASLLKAAQSKNAVRIGQGIQLSSNIANNTKAALVQPIRSTPVATNSSFGTTLSSMRSLDSKAKAAENVEDRKSIDVNVELFNEDTDAAAKGSIASKSEIAVGKEVASDVEGTKIEEKASKESLIEQEGKDEARDIKE